MTPYFLDEQNKYSLDARTVGNLSHFFNHSCNPNMRCYSVLIDSAERFLHRLAFFASRDIAAGEELTFDYSGRQIDAAPKQNKSKTKGKQSKASDDDTHFFKCLCGEKTCQGRIRFRYD